VVDGSIAAGANIIHGVRWDLKNRESLERQALRQAYDDARARAQVIATASGSTLGEVHAVQEMRSADVRQMPAMRMEAAAALSADTATAISPGEIAIRATVTASFRIQ
jgi:uncharacterized protein YggE